MQKASLRHKPVESKDSASAAVNKLLPTIPLLRQRVYVQYSVERAIGNGSKVPRREGKFRLKMEQ